MKHIVSSLGFFIFCCIFTSCSTYIADSHSFGTQVRPTTDLTQPQFNDQQLGNTSWEVLFRNSFEARVDGLGDNMKIKIPRLSNSYSDEPLFFVNDHLAGKGFIMVSHIDPNTVSRIRILRRPNEIAAYGNQGRHGVILIKTI